MNTTRHATSLTRKQHCHDNIQQGRHAVFSIFLRGLDKFRFFQELSQHNNCTAMLVLFAASTSHMTQVGTGQKDAYYELIRLKKAG
jgi:hypothetical protein